MARLRLNQQLSPSSSIIIDDFSRGFSQVIHMYTIVYTIYGRYTRANVTFVNIYPTINLSLKVKDKLGLSWMTLAHK